MNTTERKTVCLPLKEGDKQILEKMGFSILPNEEGQLLTQVILPDGWYREKDGWHREKDGQYSSYLYDEKKRQRISGFIECNPKFNRGYINILAY